MHGRNVEPADLRGVIQGQCLFVLLKLKGGISETFFGLIAQEKSALHTLSLRTIAIICSEGATLALPALKGKGDRVSGGRVRARAARAIPRLKAD